MRRNEAHFQNNWINRNREAENNIWITALNRPWPSLKQHKKRATKIEITWHMKSWSYFPRKFRCYGDDGGGGDVGSGDDGGDGSAQWVEWLWNRCSEYWAICSSTHLLAPLTHSLAPHCSLFSRALLRSFVRLLAYSLPSSCESKWPDGNFCCVSFCSRP